MFYVIQHKGAVNMGKEAIGFEVDKRDLELIRNALSHAATMKLCDSGKKKRNAKKASDRFAAELLHEDYERLSRLEESASRYLENAFGLEA
jgi:hypothetical protein